MFRYVVDTSHETRLDRLARLRVDLLGQVGQSLRFHFNVHQSMGEGVGVRRGNGRIYLYGQESLNVFVNLLQSPLKRSLVPNKGRFSLSNLRLCLSYPPPHQWLTYNRCIRSSLQKMWLYYHLILISSHELVKTPRT